MTTAAEYGRDTRKKDPQAAMRHVKTAMIPRFEVYEPQTDTRLRKK
jgi:hypothetical protein